MKLEIGKNIRKRRREADMTQEELAERLGVSYQAVSRWENGTTYPDIELLPVLAGMFGCTLDELVGEVKDEKIRQYHEEYGAMCERKDSNEAICEHLRLAFAEFPDEFSLGRDLCYMLGFECDHHDEKITDELRRVAIDILSRCTDDAEIRSNVIESLSRAETEEHLGDFLERYVPYQIDRTSLLCERYKARGEHDAYKIVAEMENLHAIQHVLYADFDPTAHSAQKDPAVSLPILYAKLDFLNAVTGIDENIRRTHPVYVDGVPDAWSETRMDFGYRISCRLAAIGRTDEALDILEETMDLYEKFYGTVTVGTVLSFSHRANKSNVSDIVVNDIISEYGWRVVSARSSDENRAALEAVHLSPIQTWRLADDYYALANREGWEWFDPIREHPRYLACMERMKRAGQM